MDSFIKIIAPMTGALEPDWLENPQQAFQRCDILQKIKFILGQAVSINYLERVFDGKLPVFIEAYKKYVLSFLFCDIENLKEDDSNSNYPIEFVNAVENIRTLLTSDKKYFSAEECFAVLESNVVAPIPCTRSFYVPYLKFIDHLRKADDVQTDANALEFKDFKVSEAVAIPQFVYTGAVLSESDETICESYTFDYKLAKKFADNNHCKVNGIFPYWLGFNYSQITFKGVLGILGTYGALEMNPVQFKNSLSGAYYLALAVIKILRPDDTMLEAIDSKAMTMLGSFLIDVCSRFKIAADADTLAMFYSTDSSKLNLVTVLLADSPESVSKEAYAMFMNSAVSKVPLKAANDNEEESEDEGDENPKKADDSEDSEEDSKKESEDDSAEIDNPPEFNEDDFKVEEDESDDESDSSPDQDDSDKSTDETTDESKDEDKTDDQTDTDENQSDDTEDQKSEDEATDSEDKEDNSESKDDEDSTEDEDDEDNTPARAQIPVPNIPGINIQSGLDLNLADDGETIDSFLYREEVGNFLEKVIESGNLSVQQESILKIIRSELLNILNISSLYNLVKETLSLDNQHSEK